MTAAKNPAVAAATSPLRPAVIQGDTIGIDDAKAGTWKAFKLTGVISNPDNEPFQRLQAMFELIEYATDTDEDTIVDKLGGDEADPNAVMAYALEVISAIASKN